MTTVSPVDSFPCGRKRRLWGGVVVAVVLIGVGLYGVGNVGFKSRPHNKTEVAGDAAAVLELRDRARALLGADEFVAAAPVLERWAELRPDDAEPLRLLMYLWHRLAYQGKTEAEQLGLQTTALNYGVQALQHVPNDNATAQEVAFLSLAVGRLDEAERVCRIFCDRQPDDPGWQFLRARMLYLQGSSTAAGAALDALLANQPRHVRAQLLRAIIHHEAGAHNLAIPLLREVIAQDTSASQQARYYLGLALARAGQSAEADMLIGEVQRVNLDQAAARLGQTDLPAVQVRRAELLLQLGKDDEALVLLQTVIRSNPADAAAHHILAAYYEKHGDARLAAEHRRRAEK